MKRRAVAAFFYFLAIAVIIGFDFIKESFFYSSDNTAKSQMITSDEARLQNKYRSARKGYVNPENPDILLNAFAEIKIARDGSKYPPNYRRIELETAKQKLEKNAFKEDIPWVERGPGNVSGRSRVVLVDPADATNNTWWLATVGGGVWKTTNAGSSWELKTPELLTLSTMTMAICQSNPDIMYVGTGMGYGRTIDLAGSGVWKSIDHGESWVQLANTAEGELLPAINRIIVDPDNENLVLLCSNGDYTSHGPNGGSRESGIFRSTDGGVSWEQVFYPEIVFANNDPETDNRVQQLIANPLNFKTLYGSVNEVGVIKSTDAGLTWTVMADNFALPQDIGVGEGSYRGISTRTELAVTSLDTNRIYAAIERPYGVADLYMSKNGGASWINVNDTGNDPNWFNSQGASGATGAYTAGWFDNTIAVSPQNKNQVFVGGVRLYRIDVNDVSNTRSTTYIPGYGAVPHADHHWLEMIPNHPQPGTFTILNANDGGMAVSYNGGTTWENITGIGSTQFYGVDKKPGENAYFGGMQDNGSFFSASSPDENSVWSRALGGDGVESVWNQRDPNLMMGGSQNGNLSRSTDGGQNWQAIPESKAGNYAPFISKIAQSKQDPDLLFTVGDAGVKRTDNFGETWTLTTIPSNWNGSRTFSNVEISVASPQVVWISSRLTYDAYRGKWGGVHVSRDGGLSFLDVSANLPDNLTEPSGIGTHPTDPGTAYLLFSATGTPKIMRTTDYGDSWQDISGFGIASKSNNGFPDVAVYALLVMPYNTNILWAGTEIGLFISTDNGVSWSIADNGFPFVSIFQMSIVEGQIIVGTHGRGIWTVDLPELAGYSPINATLSPRFKKLAFQPSGNVMVDLWLPSVYDSTVIYIDNEAWFKISENPANLDSVLYYPVSESGNRDFSLISYKDGNQYISPPQQVAVVSASPVSQFTATFDSPGDDMYFSGNGYSVRGETGFSNPAIHSQHNYPVMTELIYTLYQPIEVASEHAILYYEDVALIEEGDPAVTHYQDFGFWDYVIVEATTDGLNWKPIINGYDARFNSTWLSVYRSNLVGWDSYAMGNSNMYVSHDIDLLDFFSPGDIVFIRFRLSSDGAAIAWGWAIDNLHIQDGVSSIDNGEPRPNTFILRQNYPNPFNPETRIAYYLPSSSDVNISVFNILGQKIRTLVNAPVQTGWQQTIWDGKDQSGVSQASGVYIYRMTADAYSHSRRMLLLK